LAISSLSATGRASKAPHSAPAQSDPPAPAKEARRVIIDTDPGVDDALALLFAMRSPELKIEAITPVAGNVPLDLTLPNALRMVEVAGRTDIPVAGGARAPLARRLVTAAYVHGNNGLDGVEFPVPKTKPVDESAAEIIHRLVSRSPGEVSIIAVGPLTNVATALRAYPSLAKEIREIVLMGGSLSGGNMTPAAEFNMYVDPEAASIVFGSGVPLTMVGLDVTEKCPLTDDHVKALEAGEGAITKAAARITRNALEHSRKADWGPPAMHDPLAVATFIDRTIVRLEKYFVAVETQGELTAGETLGYKRAPIRQSAPLENSSATSEVVSSTLVPNVNVAVQVDATRFFHMFIGRLSGRG
jgi:inosine-uridine nucleoside N-ribohydrolase